jgi:predicted RecA/RadA family phage recombinase
MAKNFIQPGNTVTVTNEDVTGAVDIASGEGFLVGSLFGVAQGDIAVGADGEIDVRGVWRVAKVSAQAWTQGAKIYWDNAARLFTTTSSGNKLVGVAAAAAANPSGTGDVLLIPTAP